jgi:hypothetical protein
MNDETTETLGGDGNRKSWWEIVKACSGTAADRRNQYWFLGWMSAWAVSFVAGAWALKWHGLQGVAAWLVAVVPAVFSVGALLAYLRFLKMADELIRQMQLEGLALGFGVGVVFAMGYQLLEYAGAPQFQLSDLAGVMMIAWAGGQLLAMRRYR